jgi:hypothetical protein
MQWRKKLKKIVIVLGFAHALCWHSTQAVLGVLAEPV